MKYGSVSGIDKPISRLVQGTVMVKSDRYEESCRLLDAAVEMGCTTFDTAHGYGGGDNERTVGRWVREAGVRDKVVIIGKGAPQPGPAARSRPTTLRPTCDFAGAFQVRPHRPLSAAPRRPQPAGRADCGGPQRARARARSTLSAAPTGALRVQEANAYAGAARPEGFSASSPNFSLAVQVRSRGPTASASAARRPGRPRLYEQTRCRSSPGRAWRAASSAGASAARTWRSRWNISTSWPSNYCSDDNFERLDCAEQLARKGLTIPQIAMAYVMSAPEHHFA